MGEAQQEPAVRRFAKFLYLFISMYRILTPYCLKPPLLLTGKCPLLAASQVRMAEDIDFKYPMKKACAWEISTFCKDVPQGHARVIRCLETKIEDAEMSKECKDEGGHVLAV